jgi:hypothetical protein
MMTIGIDFFMVSLHCAGRPHDGHAQLRFPGSGQVSGMCPADTAFRTREDGAQPFRGLLHTPFAGEHDILLLGGQPAVVAKHAQPVLPKCERVDLQI